jgi:hypothetical protein
MNVFKSFIKRRVGAMLVVFCLSQAALALPTGQWLADFYDEIGIITITESSFSFELEDDGAASGFSGPLVEVIEAEGGEPGRMIVGPVAGGKFPYEVVWFFEPEGPRARFFCQEAGYKTADDALESLPDFELSETSLFLDREFFLQVDKMPALPLLNRDDLVALMEEVLLRQKANPESDPSTLMETLMIDKGYHPTKSLDPFEAALQKHLNDPEVSRILDQLNKGVTP